eukprot:CAMPEP_0171087202 /NCGR_PEP_ID=MMETSP0766_2-20121228/20008_1 /TAXON_ID=439317 /ORGANISM="Gambierdiscus australes, Strain CAWD 149" /LENGTH=101 /DNA_ID=CAMNT_0011544893 /DNA_START=89 /DNA_END=395 /DNA_ORIENTATION=+
MADTPKNTGFQSLLARQSPFGLLANFRARRMGFPVPFMVAPPVRADTGWPWRMDWGGHDPATPIAEMHINYHNTGWAIMIFVCTTTFYLLLKAEAAAPAAR